MMILSRQALVSAMTLAGMAVLLPRASMMAQEQFPWAEERPGYMDEKYQIPGMCMGAFDRVVRDEHLKIPPETLWANPASEFAAAPLSAVDTLKRCRRSPRVAALTDKRDFPAMQRVLAEIGDSAGFFELLDRRVALYAGPYEQWEPVLRYSEAYGPIAPPHDQDLAAELPDVFPASDSSVKVMRAIGPPRLVLSEMGRLKYAWREHLLERYRHLFGKDRAMRNRMWMHDILLRESVAKGDTASWRARLAVLVAFADSMTAANVLLTQGEWARIRGDQIQAALRLDSIPVTNADIWTRQVANVYKTFLPDQRPDDQFVGLGETAPPIEGTYWYRATERGGDSAFVKVASPSPLPAKGRWSLVLRVPRTCDVIARCGDFTWIRNFLRRYGEKVDLILVSSTQGSFGTAEPPAPEQEAEAVARLLFGFHKLPGTLAVTALPSRQFPKPDLRWITTGEVASDTGGYTKLPVEVDGSGRPVVVVHTTLHGVLVDTQGRVIARGLGWITSHQNSTLFDALIK